MIDSIQSRPSAVPQSNSHAERGDAELLAQFIERHDQSAFETLVRTHGPMVYGVCLRMLGNHHDAEDAFQATFLILAQKAASIVRRGLPANWLFQVAHRSALKVRTAVVKRRQREQPMIELPEAATSPSAGWSDLAPALDAEVHALPYKYQVAIVLCDLEGKTRQDAARQLGWPEGTLVTRLAKAREILANRLTRQGIVLSTASLVLLLSEHVASAAVPGVLVAATAQAAAAMPLQATAATFFSAKGAAVAKGLVKTTLLTKGVAAATLAGVVAVAGMAVQPTETAKPKEPAPIRRAAESFPPEIQRALEENAKQLSPISISSSMEWKSDLPVDEAMKRLNIPASERWLFAKNKTRSVWQGRNFYTSMTQAAEVAGTDDHPVEIETSYFGDLTYRGFRRPPPGAKNMVKRFASKEENLDAEFIMTYLGAAASFSVNWDPGEKIQLQIESEPLRAIKNDGALLAVEDVSLDGRPHVRITLETENFVKKRADEMVRRIEAIDLKTPVSEAMREHRNLLISRLDAQRNTPATRRIVYDLDPALNYAVRRSEQYYAPDTLLRRSVCSDFEQVTGRSLWLARRCVTEFHEFPTVTTVSKERLVTQTFEVSACDPRPVPDEQFVLNYTEPGTVIQDNTFPEAKGSPRGIVTYVVPPRAEDLVGVIAKARAESRAPSPAIHVNEQVNVQPVQSGEMKRQGGELSLNAPATSAPANAATYSSSLVPGTTERRGGPVLESGSIETSDRPRMIWILLAVNGLFLVGVLGYLVFKRRRAV